LPAWLTPESRTLVRDSLKAPGRWKETSYPRFDASCTLDGALVAELGDPSAGSYKCTGISDTLANFTVVVDVILDSADSCAGVWFRFSVADGGYVFTICRDRVQLQTHNDDGFRQLTSHYPQPALPIDRQIRVAAMGDGETMRLFLDGELVLEHRDTQYASGRVVLGVLPLNAQAEAPYRVSFSDIVVYRAPSSP
jgi:hypothetical protein